MKVIRRVQALKKTIRALKNKKETVGFVPTMGYLHEGHLALVRRAQKENDRVVISIFVNPLQFGPKEDLDRYPRDLGRDLKMLRPLKADVLLAPDTDAFYPAGFQSAVSVS